VDLDDGTGTPSDGPSTKGFKFNLDAALNELRRSRPPTLADLMRVGQEGGDGSDAEAPRTSRADGVPAIREATGVDDPLRPGSAPMTSWSLSIGGSDAGTGGMPSASGSSPIAPGPGSFSPVLPSYAAAAAVSNETTSSVAVMDAPAMPSIPTVPKVPVPPPVPPIVSTTPPPPTMSAASRARMNKRKRRTGVKVFLVLLVMGAVVAGALVYGRAYLFPDEWERDLVPIADDIEQTVGAEYDGAVPLRPLPVEEYDARASAVMFGTEWETQVPVWRALGLTSGAPTPATLGPVLHSWTPAVYDAATKEIVVVEDLGGMARTTALTEQMAGVLVDQRYGANTVVAPDNPIAVRAIVQQQIDLIARAANTAEEQPFDRTVLDSLPSPLAYELLARADLGAAAAAAAGLSLGPAEATALDGLDAAAGVLGVQPEAATSPPQPNTGDVLGAETFTPTRELLYLIFGAYLEADAAAAGADAVARSSITVATRNGQTCAYGVFGAADAANAGVIQFVVTAWTQRAPLDAHAEPKTFDDGTVQLLTCDPGPAPATVPRAGVAAELVGRQVALLAG
jgi:hypothetical protein